MNSAGVSDARSVTSCRPPVHFLCGSFRWRRSFDSPRLAFPYLGSAARRGQGEGVSASVQVCATPLRQLFQSDDHSAADDRNHVAHARQRGMVGVQGRQCRTASRIDKSSARRTQAWVDSSSPTVRAVTLRPAQATTSDGAMRFTHRLLATDADDAGLAPKTTSPTVPRQQVLAT